VAGWEGYSLIILLHYRALSWIGRWKGVVRFKLKGKGNM